MNNSSSIQIDIWSDYVCPFCYLEMPALAKLQSTFGEHINITWRAFELRPEPNPTLDPAGEYLRSTWERSVYPMARERGMVLRLPPVQPRSRRAFEAAEFARANGQFDAMHTALFKAFFEEGKDIGNTPVLLQIAASVGLSVEELKQAFDEGHYVDTVLEDQRLAHRMGISGVPIMVLRDGDAPWEEGVALQGAVPYEHMEFAVKQLLDARSGK